MTYLSLNQKLFIMKKNGLWIFVFIAISWFSCEPPIIFKTPPPQGVKATNAFMPSFQGTYFCESDSSVVVIGEQVIYKTDWFDFVVPQEKIERDTNISKSGEFLYIKDIGKCAIYRIKNDTVYASFQLADTLFYMDGVENVLKEYNGHQVMSLWLQEGKYEVFILSLDDYSNLQLKMATMPGDLEELEKITSIKDVSSEDVEQYEINPSLIEFDEILQKEIVFETCEYFKRIDIPNKELFIF